MQSSRPAREMGRAMADAQWRRKPKPQPEAPPADPPEQTKPRSYVALPVTSNAWGSAVASAPAPAESSAVLGQSMWLTPEESARFTPEKPEKASPPPYQSPVHPHLENSVVDLGHPAMSEYRMPTMPTQPTRGGGRGQVVLSTPAPVLNHPSALPSTSTWAQGSKFPKFEGDLSGGAAELSHVYSQQPGLLRLNVNSTDPAATTNNNNKPQKQKQPQQQQPATTKPKSGKPMSMLDLIAPQLQPQRKKKQDVKAKVGVKGSTGGKNEPQGSTLAGQNVLGGQGVIRLRGKEREVKKAKKPSKVKRVIVAERLWKDRATEIDSLALSLVEMKQSALPESDESNELLEGVCTRIKELGATLREELAVLEEALQELSSGDVQGEEALADWGEDVTLMDRKKRAQRLQDSLSKKMLWHSSDALAHAKLQSQAMQRSVARSEKLAAKSNTEELLLALNEKCGSEVLESSSVSEQLVTLEARDEPASSEELTDEPSHEPAQPENNSTLAGTSLSINSVAFVPSAIGAAQPAPETLQAGWKAGSRVIREYVDQAINNDLDQAVLGLLSTLTGFQTKLFEKDPVKAQQKRRYQCGLREVLKSARRGKLKLAVIAPNIDKIESDGGLDDLVVEIVQACRENAVPIAFALNRHKLGKAVSNRHKMSAIGVLNPDGAHEQYKAVLSLIEAAQDKWKATKPQ